MQYLLQDLKRLQYQSITIFCNTIGPTPELIAYYLNILTLLTLKKFNDCIVNAMVIVPRLSSKGFMYGQNNIAYITEVNCVILFTAKLSVIDL